MLATLIILAVILFVLNEIFKADQKLQGARNQKMETVYACISGDYWDEHTERLRHSRNVSVSMADEFNRYGGQIRESEKSNYTEEVRKLNSQCEERCDANRKQVAKRLLESI